jgi:hypothetical protein
MTWPGVTLGVERLCYTYQLCQMTNKEHTSKKYGLLPPKISESDTVSLGHGLCGSCGSIYSKDTSLKHILCLHSQ